MFGTTTIRILRRRSRRSPLTTEVMLGVFC